MSGWDGNGLKLEKRWAGVSKFCGCRLGLEKIIYNSIWFVLLPKIHLISFLLAPVVQKLDSAIHQINLYPVDNAIGFPNTYPLDSNLSGG